MIDKKKIAVDLFAVVEAYKVYRQKYGSCPAKKGHLCGIPVSDFSCEYFGELKSVWQGRVYMDYYVCTYKGDKNGKVEKEFCEVKRK